MPIETILIALSLIVLAAASLFDLKTREVPDTLSIGFIISVLGITLIYGFYSTFSYFLYGILGFVIAFIIAFILYYSKQMGGGDAKLFMGLGAAFATFNETFPLLLILLLCLLTIGGLYSFCWGLALFLKERKKSFPLFKKRLKANRTPRIIIIILSIILLALAYINDNFAYRFLLAALAFTMLFLFYLTIFIHVVEKIGFLKHYPLSKVTEGDWLAKDVKRNGKVICSAKEVCLDKKQINRLKKNKVKKVWIKIGIPFVPAIFLSTLASIIIYFLI